jgi:hypothetical protein
MCWTLKEILEAYAASTSRGEREGRTSLVADCESKVRSANEIAQNGTAWGGTHVVVNAESLSDG